MRFVFFFLIIVAAGLSVLIIGLTLFLIFKGGVNIILPGPGLVVSLPAVILLLGVIDLVIILLARLVRSKNPHR